MAWLLLHVQYPPGPLVEVFAGAFPPIPRGQLIPHGLLYSFYTSSVSNLRSLRLRPLQGLYRKLKSPVNLLRLCPLATASLSIALPAVAPMHQRQCKLLPSHENVITFAIPVELFHVSARIGLYGREFQSLAVNLMLCLVPERLLRATDQNQTKVFSQHWLLQPADNCMCACSHAVTSVSSPNPPFQLYFATSEPQV